jgi:hypothetical protein
LIGSAGTAVAKQHYRARKEDYQNADRQQ